MNLNEKKEKLSVKLDEKKVKLQEKKEQAKINHEERKLNLKESYTGRIRLGDCSPALSQEPYVSLSRHTAQIDIYLRRLVVEKYRFLK